MSWASRRRLLYILGIALFFLVTIGIPVALWLYEPATCFDGILNQRETAVDKGGPCKLLDERTLVPHVVSWVRPFAVREGMFSVAAYIENPNPHAGVVRAPYRIKLYDARNVLVAERERVGFIMPGAVTPVFEGSIDTGNRTAVRAFFEFTEPLAWERASSAIEMLTVSDRRVIDVETEVPRVVAKVANSSPRDVTNLTLVAVVYTTAGNAFAASQTVLPVLEAKSEREVTFTWPVAFKERPARIDVLPALSPTE